MFLHQTNRIKGFDGSCAVVAPGILNPWSLSTPRFVFTFLQLLLILKPMAIHGSQVECDELCQRILRSRMDDGCLPDCPITSDVRDFTVKGRNLLAEALLAGWPCQADSCFTLMLLWLCFEFESQCIYQFLVPYISIMRRAYRTQGFSLAWETLDHRWSAIFLKYGIKCRKRQNLRVLNAHQTCSWKTSCKISYRKLCFKKWFNHWRRMLLLENVKGLLSCKPETRGVFHYVVKEGCNHLPNS